MTKEQLLAEVDDLLRTMPPREGIGNPTHDNLAWLGRLSAVIEKWSIAKTITLYEPLQRVQSQNTYSVGEGYKGIVVLLHQAQHDLRMETSGPTNVAVSKGSVFEYFDEVRKVIEGAKQDVLFVDPYLDAEFVSRYLPHIAPGVTIRLLAREKLATLLPGVGAFAQQHNAAVAVRSAPNFHDRYVFIDGVCCYQSGASFKDGAKSAPTTLTQITDAFAAVSRTYEDIWQGAKVER
jgi:hypothetical protein